MVEREVHFVCTLDDFKSLKLTQAHRMMLQSEIGLWHQAYLPCGETVLDVGAGCGETAQFYLNHGAKRVICVEGDPEALNLLKENFGHNNNVEIVPALVSSVKIDIEGSERGLVFETHFPHRFDYWKMPDSRLRLYRLSEDWGSVIRKGIRKSLKR